MVNKIEQLNDLIDKEERSVASLSSQLQKIQDQLDYHKDKLQYYQEQLQMIERN